MKKRYYITVGSLPRVEVTKAEYVQTERTCGFYNTLGQPDEPATSAFGKGIISGSIEYTKEEENAG